MFGQTESIIKAAEGQGPLVFVLIVLLVGVGTAVWWWLNNIVKPKFERSLKHEESQIRTQEKLAETVAAMGTVMGDTHKGVTTILGATMTVNSETRMIARAIRPMLTAAKKISDHTGIDLDWEIGQCQEALNDGSAEMKALPEEEVQKDVKKCQN